LGRLSCRISQLEIANLVFKVAAATSCSWFCHAALLHA
jgi:hypothetical protein